MSETMVLAGLVSAEVCLLGLETAVFTRSFLCARVSVSKYPLPLRPLRMLD